MTLDIQATDGSAFSQYADVSIAFCVDRRARVSNAPAGAHRFTVEPVSEPYLKDYDGIPGNSPASWLDRWPEANWRVFIARRTGIVVGRAACVSRAAGIDMLEGRDDLAVLWDIRVSPDARRQGVGAALLSSVETYAGKSGCKELKVESQDINVPACRFYESCGFTLREVNERAYPDLPGEVQFLWYKPLV